MKLPVFTQRVNTSNLRQKAGTRLFTDNEAQPLFTQIFQVYTRNQSLEVDALVAGDIFVEAHVLGLKDVCSKVGLELLEPLYRRDTSEVFDEIFSLGFKALITGVNLKYLGEEWLGFIISKETSASFLSKIGSADPLGENGEFHTLVLDCPLYAKSFKVKSVERKGAKGMAYLNVSIV